jgi:short-subunit dehydrogenase
MGKGVALVTGASSGIGAEFARQLGAGGMDVVLVARRADRLEALRDEIERASRVRGHVLVSDLGKPDAPRELFARTEALGLEIDWLVNNAGFGSDGEFVTLPLDREVEQAQVNVMALLMLTRLYLPAMVARRRGTVINVASVGSFVPTPYMATYSGTKAFVLGFSEALAPEVSGSGVTVLTACPGAVRTEFQEVAGVTGKLPDISFMSAETVVGLILAAARKGKRTFVPGLMNRATVMSLRFMPRRLITGIAGAMFHPRRG